MFQLENLMDFGISDFVLNLLVFLGIIIPPFLIFWVFFKNRFQHRRIQPAQTATPFRMRRELKNSMVTLFIFTVIDIIIYVAQQHGYTLVYTDIDQYGWGYLVFSVAVIILVHDTWFYFIHRLMHHPYVYRHVHRVHHLSTDPSPLAAFSFHPLEALAEAGVYILFTFLLPVHLVALWSWQVVQLIMNVIAHLGYEIYPKGFNTHWLFRIKTPSTHHNMHHEKFNGNYGLYFTWWDKIFKTEFKDYNQTYDNIQQKISQKEPSEPFFEPLETQVNPAQKVS
jgi:Delta7-sterol 5-desaturase